MWTPWRINFCSQPVTLVLSHLPLSHLPSMELHTFCQYRPGGWDSLDALVGRLRAAIEEHGGRPDAIPVLRARAWAEVVPAVEHRRGLLERRRRLP